MTRVLPVIERLRSLSFRNQLYLGVAQAVCHLSVIWVIWRFSTPWFLGSLVVYFLMTSIGVSVTAHRFLSHKSFYMTDLAAWFGGLCFTCSLQGSTIAWVAMHREHHHHSDQARDPHAPAGRFWRTHFFSMFYTPKLRYVLDLLAQPKHQFLHRRYWAINAAYAAALFWSAGWNGVVYLHLFPAFLCWQGISVAKTFAHMVGYRNYPTKDKSRNIPVFGYLTFGEAWHNNHHARPNRYSFRRRWYEVDISALVIRAGLGCSVFRREAPAAVGASTALRALRP